MKKSDIKKLSIEEIDKKIIQLEEERKKKEEQANFIKDMLDQAKQRGIKIEDIKEALLDIKSNKISKIRYRLIINGEEKEYSGRGKKPKWVIDYLNSGGNLKDIEV
ncbi:H-NS family nucleoid-associated regulatory protein [Gilliamella sp. BG7]|uniref:H-NS family nucleoid-associated regulatory protein n=1 Tax=unclassified Gilliamella TaxID=2685620 RepID=UPI00398731F9